MTTLTVGSQSLSIIDASEYLSVPIHLECQSATAFLGHGGPRLLVGSSVSEPPDARESGMPWVDPPFLFLLPL